MRLHRVAFEDILDICCEVPAFIEALTARRHGTEPSRVWNLQTLGILLQMRHLRVRSNTCTMLELLFRVDPVQFLHSVCLQPICVGKHVCRLLQHRADSTHSEYQLSCFIYYLCKRATLQADSTPEYRRILEHNVRSVVAKNQVVHTLRALNMCGTEFLLRTTGVHAQSIPACYRFLPWQQKGKYVNLHKICHHVMCKEQALGVSSVNSDLLGLLNGHAQCPTYLVTRHTFQAFHTYIMKKTPSPLQLGDIFAVYLNLASCLSVGTEPRRDAACGKRLSYTLVMALVQFRKRHHHLDDNEARFNRIMLRLLKGAVYRMSDRIRHIQNLLRHLTGDTYASAENREVREACVRILRGCIIADGRTGTSFFQRTMCILSRLPPAGPDDDYAFHHILYSTAHQHIVMHQTEARNRAHAQDILPLLFVITEYVVRQKCGTGKRIKRLLYKTSTFICCSLYLWSRSTYIASSVYNQHVMLCFMVMSVNNICLHQQEKRRFRADKFLLIFHYVLLCVSDRGSMHLWQKNELRVVMRFIFLYTGFYSSDVHEFSSIDAEMIQRIVCNHRLDRSVSKSSHVQRLHILHSLSTRASLHGDTLRYLKAVVRHYSTELAMCDFVLVIVSNQLRFVCKSCGTVAVDTMMPEIVCIVESLSSWTPPRHPSLTLAKLGSHMHICIQLCKFYFRMQHVDSHDNASVVAVIDDFVVRFLFDAATNFAAAGRSVVFHVMGLLMSWQVLPGRKQSVTWLHWTFSFLYQALQVREFVHHAEFDMCLTQLMGLVATSFPVLYRSQHVQYVCEYVDALLRVEGTHMVAECVSLQDHVHAQMSRNGYLNTGPIATRS